MARRKSASATNKAATPTTEIAASTTNAFIVTSPDRSTHAGQPGHRCGVALQRGGAGHDPLGAREDLASDVDCRVEQGDVNGVVGDLLSHGPDRRTRRCEFPGGAQDQRQQHGDDHDHDGVDDEAHDPHRADRVGADLVHRQAPTAGFRPPPGRAAPRPASWPSPRCRRRCRESARPLRSWSAAPRSPVCCRGSARPPSRPGCAWATMLRAVSQMVMSRPAATSTTAEATSIHSRQAAQRSALGHSLSSRPELSSM